MKNLLICLLILLPFAARADHPGVFFNFTETAPWRKCYAVGQAEALAVIRENRIGLPEFLSDVRAEAEGADISLTYRFAGRAFQHRLGPCPFTMPERQRELTCTVEVRTPHESFSVTSYYPEIQRKWRARGFRGHLVDCARNRAKVITNVFPVKTNLAEYRMAEHMLRQNIRLSAAIAGGRVHAGGSLVPYQDWSADFGFSLIQGSDLARPEVCDAGMEQLSAEGAEQWNGTSWCPWAVELVAMTCDGLPVLRDASSPAWIEAVGHQASGICD